MNVNDVSLSCTLQVFVAKRDRQALISYTATLQPQSGDSLYAEYALRVSVRYYCNACVVKFNCMETGIKCNNCVLKRLKIFYIYVTVHRNRFLFNNQPDTLIIQIYSVIKLYMFRATSLPIIRSFILYNQHW
jgi:hypothetical protein